MLLNALNKANITKFEIFSNSGGKQISFLGGIVELSYYENILSETVRITAKIIDAGHSADADDGTGAKITASEKIKITGTEKVYLEFEDALKQKISFITDADALRISARSRISESKKDIEELELVSKEYLLNESVRVVERYDGKISDSVNKILKDVLKTEKKLDIESTFNVKPFIGTMKKPFWFTMWLASQSIPEKPGAAGITGGFLLYETHNGFKFKSIDGLLSGTGPTNENPGGFKSYIYNNTDSSSIPPGYAGKILNYDFTDTADVKDQLMMGTFNTSVNLFNSYESSFNCNPLDIKAQENIASHPGTEYGQNLDTTFTNRASRFFTGNESIGGLKPIDQSKELDVVKKDYLSAATSRYNQLYTVKIAITIAGDFSLEAGQLIFCDFQEVSSKTNPTNNPRMSGVYLIAELCHRIDPQYQSFTSLKLIRDSYGRKPK
jgi:hypothetical protein